MAMAAHTHHAKGTFEVKSFDEETIDEMEQGAKVTRAHIVQTMSGDLNGEVTCDYVMHYKPDGTATFTGYQRFDGQVGDRRGGFVLHTTGAYAGADAKARATVIDGGGSGKLSALTGNGTSTIPHGSVGTYTLNYDLS
jgi:hypothetical protein